MFGVGRDLLGVELCANYKRISFARIDLLEKRAHLNIGEIGVNDKAGKAGERTVGQ